MSDKTTSQQFGGDWTAEKLERVRKYLSAYTKIMARRSYFRTFYLDAFAGTGYNTVRQEDNQNNPLFPEFVEPDTKQFLDGSARIALQIEPRFNKFIFIEKDPRRFAELERMKIEFSELQNDIELVNTDANLYINNLDTTGEFSFSL
jgi:three-Cys-motif partner protein